MTSLLSPPGLTTDQKNPSLFMNRLVLEDYRRSSYPDVYLYDITTGEEIWVSPRAPDANQITPEIVDNRIVWSDARAGMPDIYLMTLGSVDVCPVADFSPSVHAGSSPLTVTFSDHSTGVPVLHTSWNYSNGTTSYPLSPASQTFSGAGKYRTSLTIGNLKCRNTTPPLSKYTVFIDTPPVADFTAALQEGFAPLVVRFRDTSEGEPVSWTWDFGDGSISHDQNPVHSYASAGRLYTVSLAVNNTFAGMIPDTKTKTDYIRTFLGATGSSSLPVQGITVMQKSEGPYLLYNASVLPAMAMPRPSVLTAFHPGSGGWKNITFISSDDAGFSDSSGNNTYQGNVSDIMFGTDDVRVSGVSPTIGTGWGVSYSLNRSDYPAAASITTEIWENATSTDRNYFQTLSTLSNYILGSNGIAYTAHIEKNGIHASGTATINMSVSRDWVGGNESDMYVIAFGSNSDGNTVGTVIPATYLFNDGTLDYFEAEVQDYFTKFCLVQLSGSGNPFQLITLTVAGHISPPSDTGNADSEAPVTGAGTGKTTTPAMIRTDNPPQALIPPDPGRTEKIYTNAQGVITQATLLESTDQSLQISIGLGVVAKDQAGAPLTSVTLTAEPAENVPPAPSAGNSRFTGMAYHVEPDGATFSPAVSLSYLYPQAQWGEEYSLKTFDEHSGTWQDLPTVHDTGTGRITAQIPHFCTIALFAKPIISGNSLPKAPIQTQVPQPTPAPPPGTALNIFIGMMSWVTGIVMQNVFILVVVAVLGIAYVVKRRYPGYGR
jgi:beta propeller repeat protein